MHTTTATAKTWNVLSLLEWGASYLAARDFEDARLNVELLLAHVLQLSRIGVYTQYDRPLTPEELAEFKALFKRRLLHEPLQYILGETEFMGIPLFIDHTVLIPRPETEELTQRAIDEVRAMHKSGVKILDIGTGSGNIPVALALNIPEARITSVDVSPEALATAARNIEHHHITTITLLQVDILGENPLSGVFDLIVANPPYISAEEYASLQPEVRDFEPRIATTDGGDGFRFIRAICRLATEHLCAGGILLMEIAHNQPDEARRIAGACGLVSVEVFNDLAGIPRILKAGRRP